jgi:ABC-type nitrate/sulfonate/bicarbonate transport system substrate-binding protein
MPARHTITRTAKRRSPGRTLRLGYVPLNDAAPLIMACELGLFARHGVEVELSREVGWATVRDKVLYGELDAAHAVAGLVFAATLGIGSIARPCLTGLVLNLHGNAITLSNELRERGVHDGPSLRREIARTRRSRRYVFGAASLYSSHHFVLREWLRLAGIDPARDVDIVTVPPPQMYENLRAGHVDGYCVGEPWNSLAVLRRTGWCVATSAELAPRHPEKVLLVRSDFAANRGEEHLALIAALIEACAFCDRPENRERVMEALAQPEYLDAPIQALRMSMSGTFDFGHGRIEKDRDFHIFARGDANRPTREKGEWVLQQMSGSGLIEDATALPTDLISHGFRTDLYDEAQRLVKANPHHKP